MEKIPAAEVQASECHHRKIGTPLEDLTRQLLTAYYCARSHKRNTNSQLQFENQLEQNITHLAQLIHSREYRVNPSSCFIVNHPVKREIFAADFRERVVHHLIYNAIAPMIEKSLIIDCYSCRKKKGTSFGINRLTHHIRSCTDNFSKEAFVLKLDIQGYFMNINRDRLFHKLEALMEKNKYLPAPSKLPWVNHIDYPTILYLCREVIYADPTDQCLIRGSLKHWDGLPKNKSLFGTPDGFGLPIGNLTSQLFSNLYLAEFDNYCKHTLRLKHYGRYVDDFYIVHNDKQYLLSLIPVIRDKLKDSFQLNLHPKKIYLQNTDSGLTFLGAKIKGPNIMPGQRTKKGLRRVISQYNHSDKSAPHHLLRFTQSVNSYLGCSIHSNSFKFRKKWVSKIEPKTHHTIAYDPKTYSKIKTYHALKPSPETDLLTIFGFKEPDVDL